LIEGHSYGFYPEVGYHIPMTEELSDGSMGMVQALPRPRLNGVSTEAESVRRGGVPTDRTAGVIVDPSAFGARIIWPFPVGILELRAANRP
jgi:hypothetical protein